MAVVRLADYRPAPYLLERTDLSVRLFADHALVAARLAFHQRPEASGAAAEVAPLELRGVDLELLSLSLDGVPLAPGDYALDDHHLIVHRPPPGAFVVESEVRLRPQANTTLEGLYVSGGMVTTQCEAEGFRRITFHPDRPDLLSRFRVRIEADRATCPVLLSNGNCVESGDLPDDGTGGEPRHFAVWDDPFPKPSYLFALVAGRLEEVRDGFVTTSGRPVQLRLHVEPGDVPFTGHAMASLKRAMEWDERVYGLEYDLDEYNIVAVRHFNMGAMENKSLNIFNSKLVLADAATATDAELERIESVIAHEYFHNWTGNRITCRDWFQLSLKEGLTVFRDQSFTADLHGHALNRIENVAMLRNTQFREDAGRRPIRCSLGVIRGDRQLLHHHDLRKGFGADPDAAHPAGGGDLPAGHGALRAAPRWHRGHLRGLRQGDAGRGGRGGRHLPAAPLRLRPVPALVSPGGNPGAAHPSPLEQGGRHPRAVHPPAHRPHPGPAREAAAGDPPGRSVWWARRARPCPCARWRRTPTMGPRPC